MTPKGACVGRPSAPTRRFPGTGVGVVPSADVFVDTRAADSALNFPRPRATAANGAIFASPPTWNIKYTVLYYSTALYA